MRARAGICALVVAGAVAAQGEVITRLPTADRVVALTFDACEQEAPKKLDSAISDYLVEHKVPFTIFVAGRFAKDNAAALKALSALDFVEIENHSWNHPNDMPKLPDEEVREQLVKADAEIRQVTGRGTVFFRFPAGVDDERTLADVEGLGYRVVHWRWEVGDPDPTTDADEIVRETLAKVAPGDIIILHINGRGWHTAEALPRLVEGLEAKGYRFVRLDAYLKANRDRSRPPQ